jgi:hypothetical protein
MAHIHEAKVLLQGDSTGDLLPSFGGVIEFLEAELRRLSNVKVTVTVMIVRHGRVRDDHRDILVGIQELLGREPDGVNIKSEALEVNDLFCSGIGDDVPEADLQAVGPSVGDAIGEA